MENLNPKELTLGHSYLYGDTIIKLNYADVDCFEKTPERFSGIPLTPEILTENLEFVSDNLLDEDRTPILYNRVMYFDLSMNCFINDEPIHCDFVHTVQDLMFLHTREELEFKTTDNE